MRQRPAVQNPGHPQACAASQISPTQAERLHSAAVGTCAPALGCKSADDVVVISSPCESSYPPTSFGITRIGIHDCSNCSSHVSRGHGVKVRQAGGGVPIPYKAPSACDRATAVGRNSGGWLPKLESGAGERSNVSTTPSLSCGAANESHSAQHPVQHGPNCSNVGPPSRAECSCCRGRRRIEYRCRAQVQCLPDLRTEPRCTVQPSRCCRHCIQPHQAAQLPLPTGVLGLPSTIGSCALHQPAEPMNNNETVARAQATSGWRVCAGSRPWPQPSPRQAK